MAEGGRFWRNRGLVAVSVAAAIVVLAAGMIVCWSRLRAAPDGDLRRHFATHRAGFQQLCDEFPHLGVRAVGRVPGKITLAHTSGYIFDEPSRAELEAAGLTQARYDSVLAALSAIDALQVESHFGRVSFTMREHGIIPSGSSTELVWQGPRVQHFGCWLVALPSLELTWWGGV